MVTDRCTTTCLLVFLATAKPAYSMIFQFLISLDLASHYMHMYATLVMGGTGQSHKNVSQCYHVPSLAPTLTKFEVFQRVVYRTCSALIAVFLSHDLRSLNANRTYQFYILRLA